jgi:5-methylcytosine-specific restriction endonuclease McrA
MMHDRVEQIISRSDAVQQGLKRYFTGKPCLRGHVAERFTSVYSCVICQRSHTDGWRDANPERHHELAVQREKKYVERRKAYAIANRTQLSESNRRWYAENKQARKVSIQKWKAKNPDTLRAIKHNYRAKLADRGKFTAADVRDLMAVQKGKCAHPWCRVALKKYHVDHMIPVSSGGLNVKSNLQLLCQPCNNKKWAKHPVDFAQANGFLL